MCSSPPGEELHEIRAAGRENQFRSFVFAADFLQFSRADQSEFALLSPLAEGRLRFGTCIRAGEPGQNETVRCSHRSWRWRGRCRHPAVSWP